MISHIRSKLFVPGSRPELFPKAAASEADALSFDLEDSVSEEHKAEARQAVARFLGDHGIRAAVIVRVNGLRTPHFAADVAALARYGVVNVPKVESAEDVRRALDAIGGNTKILANIETPKAVRLAAEIATADARVAGLQVGFVDLFSQCGIDPSEMGAKQNLRLMIRLAAAEAGVPVFDSAFAGVKNLDGFRAEAEAARRLGFAGKSCIHPTQVAIANQVFAPREDEIAQARNIVAAAAEHNGVFMLDGQMIDKPILERAQAVLRLAAGR